MRLQCYLIAKLEKNTRTPLNEPKYLNLFGAWNVRCRGELFALRTALGNITMEQSGSILVGSTPISDFNADGVGDLIITTEDKDINWD